MQSPWKAATGREKWRCHWLSGLADAAMVEEVEVVVVDGDLPPPHWMLDSYHGADNAPQPLKQLLWRVNNPWSGSVVLFSGSMSSDSLTCRRAAVVWWCRW